MFEKIASILGGNIFSGIADVISKVVTDPTEKAKLQAELATLQVKHEETMQQLAASDRDSARKREMEVKDWTPSIIGWVVIVGYFSIQWFLLNHVIPAEMREVIMRTLGTLDLAMGMVLGYYFGSSAGSSAKSETIDHLVGKV